MSLYVAVRIPWHTSNFNTADTAMLQSWQNGILSLLQVVMLFAADFWGGADMFGRLAPSTEERGKFFLFYSYTGISGKRVQSCQSMASQICSCLLLLTSLLQ